MRRILRNPLVFSLGIGLLSACISRNFNNPNDPASSTFVPNHPVSFLTVPDTLNDTLLTGKFYTLDVLASDPDGDGVMLTFLTAPAGLSVSGGRITWKPAKSDTGPIPLSLLASDGAGGFDTLSWTLTVLLSQRDRVLAADTGIVWLGGASNDSLYIDLPVSTPPDAGIFLTAWGLWTLSADTSQTQMVRFDTLIQASSTRYTLAYKHLLTLLGESSGKIFTGYLVSLETGTGASTPTDILYRAAPPPALLKDLRWILEQAPDSLASNQRSLADACHFDLQVAAQHAGFAAASMYDMHGKHVANILTGTLTGKPAYASEGNPANDINGPGVYFNRIRGYLTADIRPAFAGNDPPQKEWADSLVLLFDTLGIRVSQALELADGLVGAADQPTATALVNSQILPLLQPMRDSIYTAGTMPICESGTVNFKPFFRRLYRAYLIPQP